jgi:hypothetical protein
MSMTITFPGGAAVDAHFKTKRDLRGGYRSCTC